MVEDRGQVTESAAELYDAFFVPALFQAWAPRVLEAARISSGMSVLDVACGSGVLAISARQAVGQDGRVVGVDLNDGMLEVARRKSASVDWIKADAESLPFGSASFDAVVSQFGLMFFVDRHRALREMWRVLRPGGRLVVAVWDSLDRTPGYRDLTALIGRLLGEEIANLLRAPYALGDADLLGALVEDAVGRRPKVRAVSGAARYPSIRDWMHVDVRAWTLSDLIDDAQFEALVDSAETELECFVRPDESVEFSHPALFIELQKS